MRRLYLTFLLCAAPSLAETHEQSKGRPESPDHCQSFVSGSISTIPIGDVERYASEVLPNGRQAILSSDDGKIHLVDLEDGSKRLISDNKKSRPRISLSPDGKRLAAWHAKELELLELPSGRSLKKIPLDLHYFSESAFLKQGSLLAVKQDRETQLLDAESLEVLLKAHFGAGPSSDAVVSPDGKYVVAAGKDGTAHLFDLATKEEVQVIRPEHHRSLDSTDAAKVFFTPDSKHLVSYEDSAEVLDIHNLASGKSRKTRLPFKCWTVGPSADGTRIIAGGMGLASIDIASGEVTKQKETPGYYARSFTPDQSSLLMIGDVVSQGIALYDVDTLRPKWLNTEIAPNLVGAQSKFSPDGKSLVTFPPQTGGRFLVDVESGRATPFVSKSLAHFSEPKFAGGNMVLEENGGLIYIKDFKILCASSRLSVSEGEANLKPLFEDSRLCGTAFDEKAWDMAAPPVSGSSLNAELAGKYLVRFQRPKGFDPEKHLSVLTAILRSSWVEKQPDLIRGALETVMAVSPLLFDDLVRQFPSLLQLPPLSSDRNCRSEPELTGLEKTAKKYLEFRKAANPPLRTRAADWHSLSLLSRLLSKLPESEKESYRDYIAESLAHSAADTSAFQGVFLSKLYKFAYHTVKPWFGDKPSGLTDLTIVREADRLRPIVLGTLPIDGDAATTTRFGFHARALPPVPLSIAANTTPGPLELPGLDREIQWKHGKNEYKASVKVDLVAGRKGLVDNSTAFPYDDLKKDGVLSGTVMAGSNIANAGSLMGDYLDYYQGEGFVFGEAKPIEDTHGWLKEEVTSGRMDYFLKEAHSDGDEKNLFRFPQKAAVRIGIKAGADGAREEIKLIFPVNVAGTGMLLSNEEFGTWIRHREKEGKGPLVYFNTSCWSHTKAVHELEAAQSPHLVVIPTLTTAKTFGTFHGNAQRILLDRFRNGDNYQEIRTAMQRNDGYRNRVKDVYLFPDERDYDRYITSVLKLPLQISTRLQDQDGRLVNIDEN